MQKKGVFGRGQVVWERETAFSTLEKKKGILGHFPFFRAMAATQSVAAIARKNGKCPRGKKAKKKNFPFRHIYTGWFWVLLSYHTQGQAKQVGE